jgi:hypothetical protein
MKYNCGIQYKFFRVAPLEQKLNGLLDNDVAPMGPIKYFDVWFTIGDALDQMVKGPKYLYTTCATTSWDIFNILIL